MYKVVVSVANPETQRDLIRLAAASARAHADQQPPELVAVNVLQVADPSPRKNVAAERLEHQRALLAAAHDIAAGMDVSLRTLALTGSRVDEAILEALVAEAADQTLLGWTGTHTGNGYTFGPNLDSVVLGAPCEVSLVSGDGGSIGPTAALVGSGPHSPVAARRAVEFGSIDGTVPTLVNVQPPATDEDSDPISRGEATIRDVADRAELDPAAYDTEVVVQDDPEAGMFTAVSRFSTICVGLSAASEAASDGDGTIAERISSETTGTVVVVRGSQRPERSADQPQEGFRST